MTETVTHPHTIADARAQPAFGLTDVLLFLMAVIWGINFVVVKYATRIFPPVAFTGMRVGTAALFLVIFALLRRGPADEAGERASGRSTITSLQRADIVRMLLFGFLGNGLYQLFFVHGVARTRAGNAALIIAAAPAFIALIARARGMERVRTKALLGIGLSIAGVALVMAGSARPSNGEPTLLGSVLVFLGVLCWSLYTILLQPYTRRVDVWRLSAITMVGGAVTLMLASAAARGLRESAADRCAPRRMGSDWRGSDGIPGRRRDDDHRGRFPHQSMRLVLFDIDGTLLNSGGMGRAAMQRALDKVFGSPGNPSYRYDGKTDKQIVRDVMRLEGHSDEHIDSRMEKLLELYLEGLHEAAKSRKFNVRPLEE